MSQKVICKYCNEEFDIRGIRLHEKTCKSNPINQQDQEQEKDKEKKDKRGGKREKRTKLKHTCPDCGNEELRLLDKNKELELYWRQKGFNYICDQCKEILK